MMKLGTVIPYLKKFQRMHKSRDTNLASCWHQHSFTRNQQILHSYEKSSLNPKFYRDLTRKTTFLEGWSWFKFNNWGLTLGMALKIHTSVEIRLKLGSREGHSPPPRRAPLSWIGLIAAFEKPLYVKEDLFCLWWGILSCRWKQTIPPQGDVPRNLWKQTKP